MDRVCRPLLTGGKIKDEDLRIVLVECSYDKVAKKAKCRFSSSIPTQFDKLRNWTGADLPWASPKGPLVAAVFERVRRGEWTPGAATIFILNVESLELNGELISRIAIYVYDD